MVKEDLEYFSFMSGLNGACITDIASHHFLVDEHTVNHVIDAFVFLAVRCHCDGLAKNSVRLFKFELFLDLHLRALK